jgi:glycosyltransferase involved in cell wall biosynthesis
MDDSKVPGKILHIITKATWGGPQVYVYDLLQEAKNRGFRTGLIYSTPGELSERSIVLDIPLIQISTLERNINIFRDIKTLFALRKILKKERPDIVHIHSSKAGLVGSLSARFAHIPKIFFTAHGWPHNESRSEWQKIVFRFLEWLTILFSTNTIAVSETMQSQAPDFLLSKKVFTIKNGLDIFSMYGKENARTALHLPFPPHAFVFGTIAELHKNKGLDVLIRAFAQIHKQYPHTKLCIIGEGEERTSLEKIILQEKLTQDIVLLGHVQNAKEYLKAFTVFVLPSRTEALGYVLLEAGIAKIPCVASRIGGIPEIIDHEKTGLLVSAEDVRELALALSFTLNHKDILDTYAEALYKKVTSEYSKQEMFEKIFTLYSTPKNS